HSTRLRGYVDERVISTVNSFQFTRRARLVLAHQRGVRVWSAESYAPPGLCHLVPGNPTLARGATCCRASGANSFTRSHALGYTMPPFRCSPTGVTFRHRRGFYYQLEVWDGKSVERCASWLAEFIQVSRFHDCGDSGTGNRNRFRNGNLQYSRWNCP